MRSLARVWIGVACVAGLALAGPARSFEFFDGRLQIHGFAEAQIRTLARDMKGSDNWDLAQWYNVVSLELEYMAVDSGWGPFDLLSFFGRVGGALIQNLVSVFFYNDIIFFNLYTHV